jgi:hypothetical protein
LERGVRFLGGPSDLRPSDGQGRCAKGGDDELEERSSGQIFSVHGSVLVVRFYRRIESAAVDGPWPPISEHCEFEEVSGLVRYAAGDPCQQARGPIQGYLEV